MGRSLPDLVPAPGRPGRPPATGSSDDADPGWRRRRGHRARKPAGDPLSELRARYYRPPITGPKPPSDEVFVAECVRGRAVAANAWIVAMTAWIGRGRSGDRPPEFLEYGADPAAYDGDIRDTG
jgi:hypothetical protein